MAATYNTIPAGDASDSQTLLPSKPKTSTKFIVVAAAVASFALGVRDSHPSLGARVVRRSCRPLHPSSVNNPLIDRSLARDF